MSRHDVTITWNGRTDTSAVIGYDPPMRTYFAQAFGGEDVDSDQVELWLGLDFDEFPTFADLTRSLNTKGCVVSGLELATVLSMIGEAAAPHEPCAVDPAFLRDVLLGKIEPDEWP